VIGAITRGTFEFDGGSWDIDDNGWVLGGGEVVVSGAAGPRDSAVLATTGPATQPDCSYDEH
jgi:hypothetical protein